MTAGLSHSVPAQFQLATGNRDERQFGDDAGELDVKSRVALREPIAGCPDFEVDEAGIVWAGGSYVRHPLSMPFRVAS